MVQRDQTAEREQEAVGIRITPVVRDSRIYLNRTKVIMALKKVIIRSNKTDLECEEIINEAISDYPDNEVLFDMLIESTVSGINLKQKTMYTLMIRIESEE